jgi:hypothetical protein
MFWLAVLYPNFTPINCRSRGGCPDVRRPDPELDRQFISIPTILPVYPKGFNTARFDKVLFYPGGTCHRFARARMPSGVNNEVRRLTWLAFEITRQIIEARLFISKRDHAIRIELNRISYLRLCGGALCLHLSATQEQPRAKAKKRYGNGFQAINSTHVYSSVTFRWVGDRRSPFRGRATTRCGRLRRVASRGGRRAPRASKENPAGRARNL